MPEQLRPHLRPGRVRDPLAFPQRAGAGDGTRVTPPPVGAPAAVPAPLLRLVAHA
jgi:hypothetical protein